MSISFIRENSLQDAFIKSLAAILANGRDVEGSFNTNRMTKELHPCLFEITDPFKRTLLCPKRGNNPFSTLAETMWVLSGRNDVKWLGQFLPRAKDFSDDGMTWRAGYGPRIRSWQLPEKEVVPENDSVDQIDYIIKQLVRDPINRQSVISIWDPAAECTVQKSKDYPCCDWVHFLWRDKKLDCNVVIRSNDAIWGFSSINMYEWTVLQEIIAGCLDMEVGTYYQMSDSYHIYEPMYEKARDMIEEYIPYSNFNDIPVFNFYHKESMKKQEEKWMLNADGLFELVDQYVDEKGKMVHKLKHNFNDLVNKRKNLIFDEIEYIVQNVELEHPEYNIKFSNPQFGIINNLLVLYKKYGQEDNKGSNVWFEFNSVMDCIPFSDLKVACMYWYSKNVLKIKDLGLPTIKACIEHSRS